MYQMADVIGFFCHVKQYFRNIMVISFIVEY